MGLSLKELTKYKNTSSDRIPVFMDSIVDGNLFKLENKNEYVKIKGIAVHNTLYLSFYFFEKRFYKFIVDILYSLPAKTILSVLVEQADGTQQIITTSKLEKTPLFGGKKDIVYASENYYYNQLKEQVELYKRILNSSSVNIKVGNKLYKNIVSVEKTKIPEGYGRQPKSDFEFVDTDGNSICFISHKKSVYPNEMRQWGGVSLFKDTSTIQEFLSKLQHYNLGKNIGVKLNISNRSDYELSCMSTFGKDYFNAKNGPNKVDIICFGNMKLEKSKTYLVLKADKYYTHPRHVFKDSKFCPIILCEKSNSRNDLKLKSTRVIVYPVGGKPVEFI